MWGVVYDYIEGARPERNRTIVCAHIGLVPRINIQTDHRPGASPPESTPVDRCIKYQPGLPVWIKCEKVFNEFGIFLAYKLAPESIRAVWSTQAALGPEPLVAFMNALRRGDRQRAAEIKADFDAVPPFAPPGGMKNGDLYDPFAQYNIQAAKWRSEAAGLFRVGPPRAPYYDLPDEWKRQAEAEAQGFLAMRQKYLPAAVP